MNFKLLLFDYIIKISFCCKPFFFYTEQVTISYSSNSNRNQKFLTQQ